MRLYWVTLKDHQAQYPSVAGKGMESPMDCKVFSLSIILQSVNEQNIAALGTVSPVGILSSLGHLPSSPCPYTCNPPFSLFCLLSSLIIWLLPSFSLCVEDAPWGIVKPWQAAPNLGLFQTALGLHIHGDLWQGFLRVVGLAVRRITGGLRGGTTSLYCSSSSFTGCFPE